MTVPAPTAEWLITPISAANSSGDDAPAAMNVAPCRGTARVRGLCVSSTLGRAGAHRDVVGHTQALAQQVEAWHEELVAHQRQPEEGVQHHPHAAGRGEPAGQGGRHALAAGELLRDVDGLRQRGVGLGAKTVTQPLRAAGGGGLGWRARTCGSEGRASGSARASSSSATAAQAASAQLSRSRQ